MYVTGVIDGCNGCMYLTVMTDGELRVSVRDSYD